MRFADLKPGVIYASSAGRPLVLLDNNHRWTHPTAPYATDRRDGGALMLGGWVNERDRQISDPDELLKRAERIRALLADMDSLDTGTVIARQLGPLAADVQVVYPRDVTCTWEQHLAQRQAAAEAHAADLTARAARGAEMDRARQHVLDLVGADHPAWLTQKTGLGRGGYRSRVELLWPQLEQIILAACDRTVAAATRTEDQERAT